MFFFIIIICRREINTAQSQFIFVICLIHKIILIIALCACLQRTDIVLTGRLRKTRGDMRHENILKFKINLTFLICPNIILMLDFQQKKKDITALFWGIFLQTQWTQRSLWIWTAFSTAQWCKQPINSDFEGRSSWFWTQPTSLCKANAHKSFYGDYSVLRFRVLPKGYFDDSRD